mgnify:CR=1 FL=1
MRPVGSTDEKLLLGQKGGLRLTGAKRGSGSTAMELKEMSVPIFHRNEPMRPVTPLFDYRSEVMKLYGARSIVT